MTLQPGSQRTLGFPAFFTFGSRKEAMKKIFTARWLYRLGAWVLILLGAVHFLGHLSLMSTQPANDVERELLGLMKGYKMPGSGRSMMELLAGFSLTFTVLPVTLGLTGVLVASGLDGRRLRRLSLIAALCLAAETVVSILYWFAAPATFLAVATLCFAAASIAPPE